MTSTGVFVPKPSTSICSVVRRASAAAGREPPVNRFMKVQFAPPQLRALGKALCCSLALLAASPAHAQSPAAQSYAITTYAGLPAAGSMDGPGSAALVYGPCGVAADVLGNLYIADTGNHTVRRVSRGGVVTTLAGAAGIAGSADGTGSAARFDFPEGIAADGAGNVYVADTGNDTIRKITAAGVVTTLAGLAGSVGSADGTGSTARFCGPKGVAVDSTGTLYVADTVNEIIRKITPSGTVTTLAGRVGSIGTNDGAGAAAQFTYPFSVAVDSAGNLFVADFGNDTIRKITPAGVVTTLAGKAGSSGRTDGAGTAAQFASPEGVAVDGAGNVYVADSGNDTIRKITADGVVTTLAGAAGSAGSVDGTGTAARFYCPAAVAIDSVGTVYVADTPNNAIRQIAAVTAAVTTLAGAAGTAGSANGTASTARFNFPKAVALDRAGSVYLADTGNHTIRKVTSAGAVTTLAGTAGSSGSADGSGSAARFNGPGAVAIDAAGNVYIADTGNATIRKLTPSGSVTTLAGAAGTVGSTDGPGGTARFNGPAGLAVDTSGNIFVSDTGNHTIRKITPAGIVTTLAGTAGSVGSLDGIGSAARFYNPQGLAVDGAGIVYVSDTGNATIRTISPTGAVATLAGTAGSPGSADGVGTGAQFNVPVGLAVSSAGLVYVADTGSDTVRCITSSGVVVTLAGTAGIFGGLDGYGGAARFNQPMGLAVDSSGKLYVADAANNTIRLGAAVLPLAAQPVSQTVASGSTVVFRVAVSSATTASYQWFLNGVALSGATGATLVISGAGAANAGNYTATVTTAGGAATSSAANLTIAAPTANVGRLINLSVLAPAGSGGQLLTVGFVTGGSGTSGAQSLLIRATGPALAGLGVSGVLADPTLTVLSGQTPVASNDNWGAPASNGSAVTAADGATGAFPLTNSASLDAALVTSLANGGYTAQVRGNGTSFGLTLAEVYDNTPVGAYNPSSPRLTNLSSISSVSLNGSLTAGFVIGGTTARTVLIRAIGPALAGFGVGGPMPDPQLTLHTSVNGTDTLLASNAAWGGDPQTAAVMLSAGAFSLAASSHDSVILLTLAPGSYTAVAASSSGSAGAALLEIYEIP